MFDHYIALDWAQSNMALARMTKGSGQIKTVDVPSSVEELKIYLQQLQGRKILALEETNTAQWLYAELRSEVDEILICDPYRNRLLSDGPKTDKIDARKLVLLLKNDLLKPIFHTTDELIDLRKVVSGYEDTLKAGVRLKNQRSALFRGQGKGKREENVKGAMDQFVLSGIDEGIECYEAERERYKGLFSRLQKKHAAIRNLESIDGIGIVGAVKVVARVVNPKRFRNKGAWLSYCGLVKLQKESGGRSYGSRNPRYSRQMKSVFKTAAMSVIYSGQSSWKKDYEYLLSEKHLAEHQARQSIARKIAVTAWGILKSGKPYTAARRGEGCSNT
jgi:transposase